MRLFKGKLRSSGMQSPADDALRESSRFPERAMLRKRDPLGEGRIRGPVQREMGTAKPKGLFEPPDFSLPLDQGTQAQLQLIAAIGLVIFAQPLLQLGHTGQNHRDSSVSLQQVLERLEGHDRIVSRATPQQLVDLIDPQQRNICLPQTMPHHGPCLMRLHLIIRPHISGGFQDVRGEALNRR